MPVSITKKETGTGRNKWVYLEVEEDDVPLDMSLEDLYDYLEEMDLDHDELIEELETNQTIWV